MDCPPARRVVLQARLAAACLVLLAGLGLAAKQTAQATPLSFAQPRSAGYAVSGQTGLRAPAVNVCTVAAVLSGGHPTYAINAADAGAVLRVAETAANATGQTSVWSSWFVGPVGSTVVAAGTVAGTSQVALRNDQGRALAYAQVGSGATPAAA